MKLILLSVVAIFALLLDTIYGQCLAGFGGDDGSSGSPAVSGSLDEADITSGGLRVDDDLTLSLFNGGFVDTFDLTDGTFHDMMAIGSISGKGALTRVTISGSVVQSAIVTESGQGYVPNETLSISFGCTPCVSGYYKASTANDACSRCDANASDCGTDSSNAGTNNSAGNCDAGYAGDAADPSDPCTLCANDVGYFETAGNGNTCTSCANATGCGGSSAGTCIAGYGRASSDTANPCVACAAGKFKSSADNNACTDVQPGYCGAVSMGGACHESNTAAEGETICGAGEYSAGSTGTCTSCGSGYTHSSSGETLISSCNTCAAGYEGTSSGGTSGCTLCVNDVGYFETAGNGNTCTSCANATGCGGSSAGTCIAGYGRASSDTANPCVACAAGKFKSSADNNACTDVQPGYCGAVSMGGACHESNTAAEGETICIAGRYSGGSTGSCTPSAPGYCSSVAGTCHGSSTASTAETECLGGEYSAGDTGTCTTCADGDWSAPGAATCTTCNIGNGYSTDAATFGIGNGVGDGSVNDNDSNNCLCLPGWERVSQDKNSPCSRCTAGYYKSALGDSALCVANSPGTYTVNSVDDPVNIGATGEKNCPTGYYSAGNVADCTRAVEGYFAADASGNPTSAGATQTIACPPGEWSDDEMGSCTPCGTGYTTVNAGDGAGTIAQTACLCDVGYGRPSGDLVTTCNVCPAGTYKDATDNNICTDCPAGTFLTTTTATAVSDCITTAAGSYTIDTNGDATSSGAVDEALCPTGTYSVGGAGGSCLGCGTGYTTLTEGEGAGATAALACRCDVGYGRAVDNQVSGACELCPAGKYKDAENDLVCTDCSSGKFSSAVGATDSSTCLDAQAGTCAADSTDSCVSSGAVQEHTCVSNEWSYDQSDLCHACDAHAVGCGGSSAGECDIGFYGDAANLPGPGCTACSVGISFKLIVANANACESCDPNTEGCGCASAGECVAGYGRTDVMQPCVICPDGKYKDNTENEACTDCPAGKWMDTSSNSAPYTSANLCLACSQGEAVGAPGAHGANGDAACTTCKAGYANDGLNTACSLCDAGYERDSNNDCVLCGAGTYKASVGDAACDPCASGKYMDISSVSTPYTSDSLCLDCSQGEATGGATGSYGTSSDAACTTCKAEYASGLGETACSVCAAGYTRDSNNDCVSCAAGTYKSAVGDDACTECVADTFVDTNTASVPYVSVNVCEACSQGESTGGATASNGAGGDAACTACKAGYANDGLNTACSLCDAGYERDSNNDCVLCGAGTYKASVGDVACDPCLIGTYAASPGSLSCTTIPAGFQGFNSTSTEPVACEVGHYKSVVGEDTCKPCPMGHACETTGCTTCAACASGKTTSAVGLNKCFKSTPYAPGSSQCPIIPAGWTTIACEAGEYKAWSGLGDCQACPEDTFSTEPGSISCNSCAYDEFTDGRIGQTECETYFKAKAIVPVTQEITTSLSPEDFIADSIAVAAFECTVASMIDGVECGDVSVLSASGTSRRFSMRRILSSGIIVDYTVSVTVESTSNSDKTSAVSIVAAAVTDSSFTSTLCSGLESNSPSLSGDCVAIQPVAPTTATIEVLRTANPTMAPTLAPVYDYSWIYWAGSGFVVLVSIMFAFREVFCKNTLLKTRGRGLDKVHYKHDNNSEVDKIYELSEGVPDEAMSLDNENGEYAFRDGKHVAMIDNKQTIITNVPAVDFLYHPDAVSTFESYVARACGIEVEGVKIVGVTDKLFPPMKFNADGTIHIEYSIIIHYTVCLDVDNHSQDSADRSVAHIAQVLSSDTFSSGMQSVMRQIPDLRASKAVSPDLPENAKLHIPGHESTKKSRKYFTNNKVMHDLSGVTSTSPRNEQLEAIRVRNAFDEASRELNHHLDDQHALERKRVRDRIAKKQHNVGAASPSGDAEIHVDL